MDLALLASGEATNGEHLREALTIFRALGINPNKAHYNNNGQPLPVARDDCFPIDGVLA